MSNIIERKYSYGTASINKRTHVFIEVAFYRGPLCVVGKRQYANVIPMETEEENIFSVDCVRCQKTIAYSNLMAQEKKNE